jgi:hypothetical protein
MDLNSAWSLALTFITGALGFLLKDKFEELKRLDILLNKTREEMARDYTTQTEMQRITDHIDRQFDKLEAKIHQLIQTRQ